MIAPFRHLRAKGLIMGDFANNLSVTGQIQVLQPGGAGLAGVGFRATVPDRP